jgi:hypothetical protein
MMQATQYGNGAYRHCAAALRVAWRRGYRLVEARVRPRRIEVRHVLGEHPVALPLAVDEHVVEALAPHAAQEALADRVRPRSTDWRAQHPDPARGGDAVELVPVLAIVVPNQEAWPVIEWRRPA